MKQKSKQLTSLIKIFELKKEPIKNNILKINQLLDRRNSSLQKLQQYAASYVAELDNFSATTVQIIKNNRLFYEQLQQTILTEKKEIAKLETIKPDLLRKYLEIDGKINGLNTWRDGIVQEQKNAIEKSEDNDNFEQIITRMGIEKKWEN